MKKLFKIKYLHLLFAAMLPVVAVAADGPAGKGEGPSAEQRQARMAQRQAERKAHFEQRFKQADADGSGAIDRAEAEKALPHLAQRFDRIDANKDGQLTAEELIAARKAHSRHDMAQRFKQADSDGDGAVSRAEAEKALPHLAQRFDRVDANKDGRVTLEEVNVARKAAMQAHFEQRFKRADSNSDGKISRAEAEQAMPRLVRHFDRIDADKDGQVTIEEMATARKAHFEQRRGHRGSGPRDEGSKL